MFCVVNKKDTLIKSEDKTSAKVASEVVKENVEIAPPSPYANNDTFDATNDDFDDDYNDYNEDVTDEVLEEKDDLVQINVEDIKEDSETEVVSARFDEFFEEDEEEGVGPETIPPAEPISVEVIIAIDEKGIIILHSLTPISTLMHSQAAPQ